MRIAHRVQSLERRLFGVVVALVEDSEDPAHEGRVKVRFPWLDDVSVTEWCRVAQLYAGSRYGSLFIPEVGDEVLVAFIHGDRNEPVVLGGLYNGSDKPVAHKEGTDSDKKLIHTKGGHELLFDDGAQSMKVQVTTSGGHELVMDDQGQTVQVTTSGGHQLAMDDRGQKVQVASTGGHQVALDDGARTLTVRSSGGQVVEIDGSGKITVRGSQIVLDATQIKIGGEAATQPLVLGNAFLAFFNAHMHTDPLSVTTGPPTTPMLPALLSVVAKTV